jgi:hypothetical protein
MADEQIMGAEADDVQFMRTVNECIFDSFLFNAENFRKIISA